MEKEQINHDRRSITVKFTATDIVMQQFLFYRQHISAISNECSRAPFRSKFIQWILCILKAQKSRAHLSSPAQIPRDDLDLFSARSRTGHWWLGTHRVVKYSTTHRPSAKFGAQLALFPPQPSCFGDPNFRARRISPDFSFIHTTSHGVKSSNLNNNR